MQWLAGNFPIRRLSHQHNPWSFPWDTNSQLSKNQSLRLHPIGTTLADLSRKFAPIHQRTQCKTITSLDFNYESTIAWFHSFKLNHYDTNGTVKIVCLGFYISRFHTTSYSPRDIFFTSGVNLQADFKIAAKCGVRRHYQLCLFHKDTI